MLNRREFLGVTAGTGAALTFVPSLLRASQPPDAKLIERTIPSSGEKLPVIGLGRGNDAAGHQGFKDVLKAFVEGGGRMLDMVHGWAPAEIVTGTAAAELGIEDKLFWSTIVRTPQSGPPGSWSPKSDVAIARAEIETSFARLKIPKIDLVNVNANADYAPYLAALRELKREGRVRHIGITGASPATLESAMRTEALDFIGVSYAIDNRNAESTLLPLAQERNIAVIAYFPFGGNAGPNGTVVNRLFQRVGDRPLPDWAAEFGATSWAQFFLKYLVGHPAVTVVRAGTTQARHVLDNLGGGIGRLPDEATRKRMAELVDALPPLPGPGGGAPTAGISVPAATLDRYVGRYESTSGFVMVLRRDGANLLVKPGTLPEAPLIAQSATRFQDPRGPILEFQVEGEKDATGLVLDQGGERIALERK